MCIYIILYCVYHISIIAFNIFPLVTCPFAPSHHQRDHPRASPANLAASTWFPAIGNWGTQVRWMVFHLFGMTIEINRCICI